MQELQPAEDALTGFGTDGPDDNANGASFVAMLLEGFVIAEGGGAVVDLGLQVLFPDIPLPSCTISSCFVLPSARYKFSDAFVIIFYFDISCCALV
jgi:hypothetical protein